MILSKNIKAPKAGQPKKNLAAILVIVVLMVVLMSGAYLMLTTLFATENYYVLKHNVAARVRVTPAMLQEMTVSKGGSPQNAITFNEVRNGMVYTRIPLNAGDVLSRSNTGQNLDSNTGIPDDWVITSFNIPSSLAAGGRIMRGDYFDVIGVRRDGAQYLLLDVLALDVNYSAKTTTDASGNVTGMNEQLQYIVGLPPEDAAILTHALDGHAVDSIRLTLSPMSVHYKERNVEELNKLFVADDTLKLKSFYEGTDDMFTPVLRDDNHRPVNKLYCEAGKIVPADLCKRLSELEKEENRDVKGEFIVDEKESKPSSEEKGTEIPVTPPSEGN